jgi:acyl-CoA hydrolase
MQLGVGPTARARECTRQFCARPEYREIVRAYAMRAKQSQSDQSKALTCITRSEQDMKK